MDKWARWLQRMLDNGVEVLVAVPGRAAGPSRAGGLRQGPHRSGAAAEDEHDYVAEDLEGRPAAAETTSRHLMAAEKDVVHMAVEMRLDTSWAEIERTV